MQRKLPISRPGISIHALREEGDLFACWHPKGLSDFYPRPPRGGRLSIQIWDCQQGVFLSTPSARRATFALCALDFLRNYFYPRPPRGGRPLDCRDYALAALISIHALREEGDLAMQRTSASVSLFLSTPSARRATHPRKHRCTIRQISIHALREEGDFSNSANNPGKTDFYPRPPRGGRLCKTQCKLSATHFYPRPPRGGRPASRPTGAPTGQFLSTPSARRATEGERRRRSPSCYFYPRPPRGGRQQRLQSMVDDLPISIHALREEGDRSGCAALRNCGGFLSTPSARRATYHDLSPTSNPRRFLSTPSARRATSAVQILDAVLNISIHALREEGDGVSATGRACC